MEYTSNTNIVINNKRRKLKVGLLIASIFFGIYAISLLIPLIWGLIMSLQTRLGYVKDMMSLPKKWMFVNYKQAFSELDATGYGLPTMIFNSAWFALGSAFLHVITSVLVGYACANYKFFLNRVMYWIAIVTMMIPVMGSLPASIKVSAELGLYNNPFTVISAASSLGETFIISYAFFKGVSWSYAESAFIDGAGHFRVLFQIMLPLAWSPIIALVLTDFIANWCDAMGPLIFLPDWPTLASGFYIYQIESQRELNYPVLFAGLFISAIPVIVLYLIFQDTLMDLQIGGGLKG